MLFSHVCSGDRVLICDTRSAGAAVAGATLTAMTLKSQEGAAGHAALSGPTALPNVQSSW